jgi:hypothetical protein
VRATATVPTVTAPAVKASVKRQHWAVAQCKWIYVSVGDLKGPLFRLQLTLKETLNLQRTMQWFCLVRWCQKKKKGEHLKKGLLALIIAEAKEKYNILDDVTILETTVQQQLKHKSNSGKSGLISPMEGIKPYIVSIIIQLVNMRVPISSSQG